MHKDILPMRRTIRNQGRNAQQTNPAFEEFSKPDSSWATRTSKADVASLFAESVQKMDRDELLHVIEASELPWIDAAALRRLEFADRTTLVRVAQVVRRSCRRQGY